MLANNNYIAKSIIPLSFIKNLIYGNIAVLLNSPSSLKFIGESL